jgi:hypothetical protein
MERIKMDKLFRFQKNFKKIVYGFKEVIAKDEAEAQKKFDNDDYDEFDNKSDYEEDEEITNEGEYNENK